MIDLYHGGHYGYGLWREGSSENRPIHCNGSAACVRGYSDECFYAPLA